MHTADLVGWAATAVFVGSYAFKQPEMLRRAQMIGASIWIGYGVLMQATPVVVANVLVPVLEQIANWRPAEIRALFESYGLTLQEWEKARTDWVTVRELPPAVA